MVETRSHRSVRLFSVSFLMLFILSTNEYKVNAQEIYTLPILSSKNLTKTINDEAAMYEYMAVKYRDTGNFPKAISYWEEAIKIYRASDRRDFLAKTLTDQAQAYLSQGNYRKSIKLLVEALEIAQTIKAKETQTVAWGLLGNARFGQNDLDNALSAYYQSLNLAGNSHNQKYAVTALNNLFNVYKMRSFKYLAQAKAVEDEGDKQTNLRLLNLGNKDRESAKLVANRALLMASGGMPEVRTLINLISILPNHEYEQRARDILQSLPNSHLKAYAIINLAKHLETDSQIQTLKWGNQVAESINDSRAQSFALGALGGVYELKGQYSQALGLTLAAEEKAQRDSDSLYRWQWQAGRLYTVTGNRSQAIAAYKNAIATLQSIRSDIIVASSDLQFDVRDEVEPVYRELTSLLLRENKVKEVLGVFNLLKLTELQDFFGDECLKIKQLVASGQPSNYNNVLIYSIMLPERSYMVLRLPDGSLKSYPIEATTKELQTYVKQFRDALEDSGREKYAKLSQKLYQLLIKPLEVDLSQSKTNRLVFVNDGILRSIPMAALNDGKQFLVQKYVISTSLGLDSQVAASDREQNGQKFKVAVFGLTVGGSNFPPLPSVNNETQDVSNRLGGGKFLDKQFTLANLEKQLEGQKNYSVIHIATHGFFSGTPETTFIRAYDQQINLKEFEKILRKNSGLIELLTLSACETATGDNRSTLGLAGLAIRNNVKNVLATLWFINDARTVRLMNEFYYQLKQPDTTPAEALRKAQIKLISDPRSHPSVWSAFVLVSN